MQSTFIYNQRSMFCQWLNKVTKSTYTSLFKKSKISWNLDRSNLRQYKAKSLGLHLYNFLKLEGFNLMGKHETHDVFHVLGEFKTTIEEEIAMQCFLFGNGKRTLYMALSIGIGLILIPEFGKLYLESYKRGKQAFPIYQLNFKPLLPYSIQYLRWLFSINPKEN